MKLWATLHVTQETAGQSYNFLLYLHIQLIKVYVTVLIYKEVWWYVTNNINLNLIVPTLELSNY